MTGEIEKARPRRSMRLSDKHAESGQAPKETDVSRAGGSAVKRKSNEKHEPQKKTRSPMIDGPAAENSETENAVPDELPDADGGTRAGGPSAGDDTDGDSTSDFEIDFKDSSFSSATSSDEDFIESRMQRKVKGGAKTPKAATKPVTALSSMHVAQPSKRNMPHEVLKLTLDLDEPHVRSMPAFPKPVAQPSTSRTPLQPVDKQ